MQNPAIKFETLNPEIINYINKLETKIKEVENNNKTLQAENELLHEKLKKQIYQRFESSAERFRNISQILLFDSEPSIEKKTKTKQYEFEEIKSYTRKKKGRKPLDPRLPREERIIDIPDSEKKCGCGHELTRIGEEKCEKLQIIEPKIYVEVTVRPKYACRHCEGTEDEGKPAVRIEPVPPSIIPKSIVTPSLLSKIIIQKFEDHLPYYRQVKQFERIMVSISRQNMSNWQQQAFEKVKPVIELLKETLKTGPVIQMDETTVPVMREENRSNTQKSYMWLALGGPPDKKVALYQYRETRKAEHARKILEGYCGYLQTDGYSGYDSAINGNDNIIHVACLAHVRRKFYEATKVSKKSETAEEGIAFIKEIYSIERLLREKLEEKKLDEEAKRKWFVRIRYLYTYLPLKRFKDWLLKQQAEVNPSGTLGGAINYSLEQWDKFVRYRESFYLTPDNNACENGIRPFVVGRKNWMICGNPTGADSSCGMYTLIQTAKQNGVEPLKYLRELFEKAPLVSTPEDWDNLLPWNIFNP